MIDIYLNDNYSPLFYQNTKGEWSLALLDKDENKMALRNRVQAELNNKLLSNLEEPLKMSNELKRIVTNTVIMQAQFLGIKLSLNDLKNISFSTDGKSLKVNLNL